MRWIASMELKNLINELSEVKEDNETLIKGNTVSG